jgi:anti-sigma B factor antagonist
MTRPATFPFSLTLAAPRRRVLFGPSRGPFRSKRRFESFMKMVKKEIKPGVVVMQVTGRFTMGDDCLAVEKEVDHHLSQNEKHLILDLAGVNHIDSAAVGQIVKAYTKLKKNGGTLRLTGVAGMVDRVLSMTHVDRVIRVYPSADEASKDLPA